MKITRPERMSLLIIINRHTRTGYIPAHRKRAAYIMVGLSAACAILAATVNGAFVLAAGLLFLSLSLMVHRDAHIGAGGERVPLSPAEIATLRRKLSPDSFATLCGLAGTDAGELLTLGHLDDLLNIDLDERADAVRAEIARQQQEALR